MLNKNAITMPEGYEELKRRRGGRIKHYMS